MKHRGFTLIEMVIAVALLAIVAMMSYRALTGIIRGQQGVIDAMADLRETDRLFDQLAIDLADAVPDTDLGAHAIAFDSTQIRIVRTANTPGGPPRWQVVRYRSAEGVLWRELSAPLSSRPQARAALFAAPAQRQALVGRAAAMQVRGWVNDNGKRGWASTDGERKPPAVPAGTAPTLPQNAVGGIEIVVLTGSPPNAYRRVLTSSSP
ncbi:hypothetical protein RN01_07115 [Cupriavidus sp. SHE]|jgi:general secretion pathway protein J|uniref:Prepilin-type N-terminal cleavage/methylation domain-containing protein n=1 Tax=Cupriavidus metallidurans TaxID=119219 RepID=A0A482IPW9_9BURK|nr:MULTISPECIES: prepilin-type N-terminal cleavage/methylation domain-containing protein [Cupriavidus]KWR84269.1 hypothetical protein RN01_07115 [Cupriavidus sp. SHE]QBP09986.1 prepilin-type N-terminal cleavage/methylation domain-containing protein [Cupriavidus metallidurans]